MKTALLTHAGPTAAPSNSADRFAPFANGGALSTWSATSGPVRTPVARAGAVKTLRARFPTAITTGSYVLTLQKNGSDTALTCTINSAGITASDLTNIVNVAPGDDLCWKVSPSGSPEAQAGVVQIAAIFEGSEAGKSVLFSHHNSGSAAGYLAINGGSAVLTEDLAAGVVATPGDLTALHVRLNTAPGVGNSRTYTLRKNGSDTALTVTISGTNTAGSITGTTVSVVPGDDIVIGLTLSGTPASSNGCVGLDWAPTTDGESLLFTTWGGVISAAAARYGCPNGHTNSGQSTESNAYVIAPEAMELRKLRAKISTGPGASKSRAFTLRKNDGSEALSVSMTGSTTAADDSSNTVSVAAGDRLAILAQPTGSPDAVTWARVGMVAFIDPGTPPAPRRSGLLLLRA